MDKLATLDLVSLSSVTGGAASAPVDNLPIIDPCLSAGLSAGVSAQKDYRGLTNEQSQKVFDAFRRANEGACRALSAQGIKRRGMF